MRAHPKARRDVVCKALQEEVMLYDPLKEDVHVLNNTSHFIWNLLDGKHTPEDIEKKIQSSFSDTVPFKIFSDIQEILKVFEEKGLLE
ncbi:MAG: PqqD family peptide modification chaperone [Chlamydiae bacterium]|nr:PqqD family peptide modification chaperone [Chlamydiota bacterium]MBI3265747.1 PqqD family peptide modification chaperone [Chlamydiota bacterium]